MSGPEIEGADGLRSHMLIRHDCRHFLGDRPCVPHKREGVHCSDCGFYEAGGARILVIKLDALGDVVRTTCILDALHTAHPGARVEWLTCEGAIPIFDGNPLVYRVHGYPGTAWVELLTQRYDLVINLDNSPVSGRLATIAQGERKIGFGYAPQGHVFPLNAEAHEWYRMGLFDNLKLANRKTYQQIVLEICSLPTERRALHIYLSAEERRRAADRARALGMRIERQGPVIGFNTGASERWSHKKWTENGFVELAGELLLAGDPAPEQKP